MHTHTQTHMCSRNIYICMYASIEPSKFSQVLQISSLQMHHVHMKYLQNYNFEHSLQCVMSVS